MVAVPLEGVAPILIAGRRPELPAGRSSGGHRLYDAESVARLELVATLRELGLGLDEVARVLAREATVADVAGRACRGAGRADPLAAADPRGAQRRGQA
jgi:DNA-binding transcriptional MerR regulator